jgi:outer membrane protein TolC
MRTPICKGTILAGTLLAAATVAAQTPPGVPRASAGEVLPLKRAVALAVQNSRELALARLRQTVTEKATGVARSLFHPNLYTGSGAAYTSGFPQTPSGPPTLFNLSYVQTVFNLPLRGQLRASEERARKERLEVQNTEEAVMLTAAATYLELAKVRHALALLRAERGGAQRIADVTRLRAGEGLELAIEVTRAQLTAARIEQRIIQHETREEGLAAQLRELTGLPPDREFDVSADELAPVASLPAGEAIMQALASNTDLKAAEHERQAREFRLRGEKGGYWPTLDLVGHYGLYTRANNFDDFYTKFERHGVTIGVSARIPIFSSRTRSQVALAQADLSAAELELKHKRALVEAGARQQIRAGREADATREVARLELQLAQENVRLVQAQFDEGRAGLRELEKARLDESERWMQFIEARFAQQKAQLELLRVTGQLSAALR